MYIDPKNVICNIQQAKIAGHYLLFRTVNQMEMHTDLVANLYRIGRSGMDMVMVEGLAPRWNHFVEIAEQFPSVITIYVSEPGTDPLPINMGPFAGLLSMSKTQLGVSHRYLG